MCGQPPNHRQNASAERERDTEREREKERKKERQRETEGERKGARQILDGRKQLCQRLLQLQRRRWFVCLEIIRDWFHHQLTALAANRFCNRC